MGIVYSWEDAGRDVQRFDDYTFHISDAAQRAQLGRQKS